MTKYKRNDPCPCGSGKKFKKCCERTLIGKKFRATKIESTAPSTISSFFQNKITQISSPNVNQAEVKSPIEGDELEEEIKKDEPKEIEKNSKEIEIQTDKEETKEN